MFNPEFLTVHHDHEHKSVSDRVVSESSAFDSKLSSEDLLHCTHRWRSTRLQVEHGPSSSFFSMGMCRHIRFCQCGSIPQLSETTIVSMRWLSETGSENINLG
uniref:Uncharacterized protein n=1 Tax=Oryza sativa subsp. japonica TaxID=39947 RepID=Q69QJ4_ORYSJ|nr:hypothetical protein [Oryza sativa Japonica Group]